LCKALSTATSSNDPIKNFEYYFVFALVWAIGGGLSEKDGIDYRKDFSNWWKGFWKSSVKFPSKGTIFDYYVENSETTKFVEWSKKIESIPFDS
jgi:dynein heavy chain